MDESGHLNSHAVQCFWNMCARMFYIITEQRCVTLCFHHRGIDDRQLRNEGVRRVDRNSRLIILCMYSRWRCWLCHVPLARRRRGPVEVLAEQHRLHLQAQPATHLIMPPRPRVQQVALQYTERILVLTEGLSGVSPVQHRRRPWTFCRPIPSHCHLMMDFMSSYALDVLFHTLITTDFGQSDNPSDLRL